MRLLVLTGPGGVGKTRLALEAAGRAMSGGPDGGRTARRSRTGWCFVPLAGITSARQVAPAIGAALGLRGDARRDAHAPSGRCSRTERHGGVARRATGRGRDTAAADVARFLRQRGLLLILDGFERVQGAAPEVGRLLAACPQLTIMVTSRAVLRLSGEHEIPVGPLPLPRPADVAAVAGEGQPDPPGSREARTRPAATRAPRGRLWGRWRA